MNRSKYPALRRLLGCGLVILGCALGAIPTAAVTVTPDETDPAKIMQAVHDRYDGDKMKARMTMTVVDRSGAQRVRQVRSRSMDFPEGTKQLVQFESPADVRNTGLLTIDYKDGKKTDDQWLYMPASREMMRISSSDKSGSFMGSDLSYSDMTRESPDQYDYTLLKQSSAVRGEDCWLIESRPRTDKAKDETGYIKSKVWVSKSKLIPIQAKHWVRQGKKLKFLKLMDLKQIAGVWIAHKILAMTKQNKTVLSKTSLVFSNVTLNSKDVSDKDFTQRRLEQGL